MLTTRLGCATDDEKSMHHQSLLLKIKEIYPDFITLLLGLSFNRWFFFKLVLLGFLIQQFLFQFAIGFSKIEPFLEFTAMNNICMLKDKDAEVGVIGSVTKTVVVTMVCIPYSR